ncbi:T9SS type A sorting domain-containing protein [bacterium]|nr:T9SS type A sorting domain-containing protein [bacterium]
MKTRNLFFGLLTLSILVIFPVKTFSQLNWTWYVESITIESGYVDVIVGIKANSVGDEGDLGNFTLIGTFSEDLYDFGEETGKDPTCAIILMGAYDLTFLDHTGFYDWYLKATWKGGPFVGQVTAGGVSVFCLRIYIRDSNGSTNIILNKEGDYQETYEFLGPNPEDQTIADVWYDNSDGDVSLPVQMTSLTATASQENGISIAWRTESETNCAGFHVWRSSSEKGFYERITTELISGQGNQSSATEYLFVDQHVEDNVVYWYKVEEISTSGESRFFGPISVVGVSPVPQTFELSPNYPNPFNPKTRFEYQIPDMCDVFISIYSILGQEIKTWIFENQEKGYYSLEWDGRDWRGKNVPSGVYLLKMRTAEFSKMRRMTVIR